MKRILLVVAALAVLAGPAWGEVDVLKNWNKPLTEKEAAEIVLLFGILAETAKTIESGKDAGKEFTGKTMKEIFAQWVARKKKEQEALAKGNSAASRKPSRGEVDAGGGFFHSNTSVKGGSLPAIIGEISNRSGRDYQMAMFQVALYDRSGKLMGTAQAMIQNFQKGGKKAFEALLPQGVRPNAVSKYKIQFETGM